MFISLEGGLDPRTEKAQAFSDFSEDKWKMSYMARYLNTNQWFEYFLSKVSKLISLTATFSILTYKEGSIC